MTLYQILFLFLMTIGLSSCDPNAVAQKTKAFSLDTCYSNVSYGQADTSQRMDVWLVRNRTVHTPLAVLVHGGGWTAGDKSELNNFAQYFLSKGINVVNVNYRLTTGNVNSPRYTDMMADIGQALQYTAANAAKWKIRKNQFVFFGLSAGAHLSLLFAYSYDHKSLVSAVCGIGTPTKLNDGAWNTGRYKKVGDMTFERLTGKKWTGDTASRELIGASPYFAQFLKPTFLLHGEKDAIVPPGQSVLMYKLLQRKGVDSKYLLLRGAGHSGGGLSSEDAHSGLEQCTDWIKKHSH